MDDCTWTYWLCVSGGPRRNTEQRDQALIWLSPCFRPWGLKIAFVCLTCHYHRVTFTLTETTWLLPHKLMAEIFWASSVQFLSILHKVHLLSSTLFLPYGCFLLLILNMPLWNWDQLSLDATAQEHMATTATYGCLSVEYRKVFYEYHYSWKSGIDHMHFFESEKISFDI